MLTPIEREVPGRRHECIGYAAFVTAQKNPEFAKWFDRLGDAIARLHDDKPVRMCNVQHALIDLIDLLDPACERYERRYRGRLSADARPFQEHVAQPVMDDSDP